MHYEHFGSFFFKKTTNYYIFNTFWFNYENNSVLSLYLHAKHNIFIKCNKNIYKKSKQWLYKTCNLPLYKRLFHLQYYPTLIIDQSDPSKKISTDCHH